MTGKAHGGGTVAWRESVSVFRHGLPMVLVWSLVAMLAHTTHLLSALDSWVMRQVVTQVLKAEDHKDQSEATVLPSREAVLVVEASPFFRIRHLDSESSRISREDIERVGGVRPIRRDAMVKLLHFLAVRLEAMPRDQLPRAVAIDVDLAPLSTDGDALTRAATAELQRLRRLSNVIVATMHRDDVVQRKRRNAFMAGTSCTRTNEPLGRAGGLYFASPHIFHEVFGYPLRFPYERNAGAVDQPPVFPSIGNLLHLLMVEEAKGKKKAEVARKALTFLCEQAHVGTDPAHRLIEDDIQLAQASPCVPGRACFRLADFRDGAQWFNWKARYLGAVDWLPLDDYADLEECQGEDSCLTKATNNRLAVKAMIVSISGGDRHDKFNTADSANETATGATVHALQAQSSVPQYSLRESKSTDLILDLLVGVTFLVIWSGCSVVVRGLRDRGLPASARMLNVAIPPSIAVGLGFLAIYCLSPLALEYRAWCNPVYVLLGLVLHAYHEATMEPQSTGSLAIQQGARDAPSVRGRDFWLPRLLCWVVVLASLAYLAQVAIAGAQGRADAALAIVVVLIALAIQHWGRKGH